MPSFDKLKNATFEEALVLRSEELVQLIFNGLIEIKR